MRALKETGRTVAGNGAHREAATKNGEWQRIATVMWFTLAVLVLHSPVAEAQAEQVLKRGVKVRVNIRPLPKIGYVDTLTSETLAIHEIDRDGSVGSLAVYRRDFLRSVDVAVAPRGGKTLIGGVLGLVIGAGVGFVIGSSVYSEEDCDILACSPAEAGKFAAVWGGIIGLPVGLIVGSMRKGARWEPVTLGR